MNITLLFKSKITTEETYPHCFEIKYVREIQTHIDEYQDEHELLGIFLQHAYKFENTLTKDLHVVDSTTEILGCTFVHDAKTSELLDLARLGIERI